MKKTKVLLTLACAILLVAASVMGTLAWLTDASAVKNTFTVGNIHFDEDDGLHGLDEAKVNLNGEPINNQNTVVEKKDAPRVVENTYKLVPGHEYTKDPIIHVAAGSEDCYLFVKVTNEISAIEDKSTTDDKKTIAEQMGELGWMQVVDNDGDPIPGVYMLKEAKTETDPDGSTNTEWVKKVVTTTATANTDVTVFNYFKLADNADVSNYEGKSIKVVAYAVQVDGFEEASAYEIWNSVFAGKADPEVPSETTVATEPAVVVPEAGE